MAVFFACGQMPTGGLPNGVIALKLRQILAARA
jgi:hypothetical protein